MWPRLEDMVLSGENGRRGREHYLEKETIMLDADGHHLRKGSRDVEIV